MTATGPAAAVRTPRRTPSRAASPHRVATTLLTLGVPAVEMLAATAIALAWRPRLPDPVASHWGPDGVNGTSSVAGLLAVMPTTCLALSVLLWAVGFFFGQSAMTRRFAAGTAVWTSTFVGSLVVVMLAAQLDVASAADAHDLGAPLAVAVVGSLAAAVGAAWATPGDEHRPSTTPVPDDALRLPLPDGGTASWVRHLRWGNPVWFVLATVGFAAAMGVVTRSWWFAVALTAVLVPVLGAANAWTVTVDRRGLIARSLLPRPRVMVPLDEVEDARVVTVEPLREFGGWGVRAGLGGRVGVILRRGEALEVRRTGGRVVVVTVDDAATAAALLNTLAARTRA